MIQYTRLVYDVQFWMDPEKRTPFTIICDEAHLYLPVKEDADSVQKQALYNFERIIYKRFQKLCNSCFEEFEEYLKGENNANA